MKHIHTSTLQEQTLQFNEPIGGVLSPNHYIEIAKDPGGADGKSYSQPQRMLIFSETLKPEEKCFHSLEDCLSKQKELKDSISLEIIKTTEALQGAKDKLKETLTKKLNEEKGKLEDVKNNYKNINDNIEAAQNVYKSVNLYILRYQKGKLKEALKLLPEEQFTQIALDNPTQDNLDALTEELDSRWKSDSQIDGHLFVVSEKVDQLKSDSKHVTLIKKEDSEK